MERIEQAKELWHKAFENLVDDMEGLTRGQLASCFFELGWRAADENPPKETSLIKWQTGTPTIGGKYLVCLKDGSVTTDKFLAVDGLEREWKRFNKSYVVGWCKLSDVEVFKEV